MHAVVLGAAGRDDDDRRRRCPPTRAASITLQPSRSGSIRSRTTTSGRSNRSRARPCSPFADDDGIEARRRADGAPCLGDDAVVSTIRTLAILDLNHGGCEGLPGASGRIHGCGLARAADAAGAAARAARDGCAARAPTATSFLPRRERGRADDRARERRALPLGARERSGGRRPRRQPKSGLCFEEVHARLADSAERADDRDPNRRRAQHRAAAPAHECCRPIVENLAQNSIRYAGPGADADAAALPRRAARSATTVEVSRRRSCPVSSSASIAATALARSRGTGLGLAIVKHVVVSRRRRRSRHRAAGAGAAHRVQVPRPVAASSITCEPG